MDGGERQRATLARLVDGRIQRLRGADDDLDAMVRAFLDHQPEAIVSPEDLARRMARLTDMIRDIIMGAFARQTASHRLSDLRRAFQEVLIPDLTTSDFADMFAQTLAYGLFGARVANRGAEPFQRLGAAREIPKTNPFLRTLFDAITGDLFVDWGIAAGAERQDLTGPSHLAEMPADSDGVKGGQSRDFARRERTWRRP